MTSTKTEILNLGEQLIRSKGFHAFSYKDISTPLNIKNAAIHYHFPTKSDLGVAIIQRTRVDFAAKTKSWEKESSKNQILHFINIYKRIQEKNLVCFMGALGSDFDALPESMQKELTKASHEIRSWVQQTLEKGLASKELFFKEEVSVKADLIISSLLASLVLNKVTGEDILKNVMNAISMQI